MEVKKVSVIIPTYNVEKYIIPCLESVARQTYPNIECIIVDDCGTDKSIFLAESFIYSYNGYVDFLVYHREQNGGLSAARNSGLKIAKGEYVYFLDSDDELYPYSIESLVIGIKNAEICVGGFSTISEENVKLKFEEKTLLDHLYERKEDIVHSFIDGYWPVMAWNKLMLKSFIEEYHLYFKEGLIHEDELWNYYMLKSIRSLATISNQTYKYRQRIGSIMTKEKTKNRESLVAILQEIADDLPRQSAIMHEYYQKMFYYVGISVFTNKLPMAFNYSLHKQMIKLPIKVKSRKTFASKVFAFSFRKSGYGYFACAYILSALKKKIDIAL